MAPLSRNAEKLYAWLFGLYKLTPKQYNDHLKTRPKAHKKGAFALALEELLVTYGS